jgi:hypothetical protein
MPSVARQGISEQALYDSCSYLSRCRASGIFAAIAAVE